MVKALVKTTKPKTVAFKSVKGSYSKIPETLNEIYSWISEKGLYSFGSPIVAYFNTPVKLPEEISTWEARIPLEGDVELSEPDESGIGVKRVGVFLVATMIHRASYETIGQSYKELAEWISDHEYVITGPYEETYFNSPEEVPVGQLMKEIRFPVCEKITSVQTKNRVDIESIWRQ